MNKQTIAIWVLAILVVGSFAYDRVGSKSLGGGIQIAPSYNTASSTRVSVGHQVSSNVLSSRGGRGYAILCNNSTQFRMYLELSATAITATTSADIPLEVNTCYEINRDKLYTGMVQVITETATTSNLLVTEYLGT